MNNPTEYMGEPAAPYFVIAASDNFDKTGSWEVPEETKIELGRRFGLNEGQIAAHAYLAKYRAEEFAFEAELAAYDLDSEEING